MATKKATPRRKAGNAARARVAPKKPRRAAKAAKPGTSRTKARRVQPAVVGEVTHLGVGYYVVTDDVAVKTRQIKKLPADKAVMRARNGNGIRWTSTLEPFRIVFNRKTPPDTRYPDRLVFPSTDTDAGRRIYRTEKVEIHGHPPNTELKYDIYMPANAAEPLDPSIIIDEARNLRLIRKT